MKLAACDRTIGAPVDVVWALLSTADGLTAWMAVDAEIDLRIGGVIRWCHDNGWVVAGEFTEIVPMRRLAFTYGWETGGFSVPVGSSLVTIELEGRSGVTHVAVRHTGLTDAMAEQHDHGWALFVGKLASTAEGHS